MNIKEIIKDFIKVDEKEVLNSNKVGMSFLTNIFDDDDIEKNLFFNKKEFKFYKIVEAEAYDCDQSLRNGWCSSKHVCFCYKFITPEGNYFWQTCLGDYEFEPLELTKKEVILLVIERKYYEFTNEIAIYNVEKDEITI